LARSLLAMVNGNFVNNPLLQPVLLFRVGNRQNLIVIRDQDQSAAGKLAGDRPNGRLGFYGDLDWLWQFKPL